MKDLTAEEFSGHIPMSELTRTFSCSSGPGGQNVNKVATKVDIRSVLFQYLRFCFDDNGLSVCLTTQRG